MKTILMIGFLILSTIAYAQPSVFDETVVEKKNWEPAIPRPEQEKVADAKLNEFEQKHHKKPNILIFLVDDMGWGDPGVYGGGPAIGAPTPNIDKLKTFLFHDTKIPVHRRDRKSNGRTEIGTSCPGRSAAGRDLQKGARKCISTDSPPAIRRLYP